MPTKLTAAGVAVVAAAAAGAVLTAGPAEAQPSCVWNQSDHAASVYCADGPTGADTYRARVKCWQKGETWWISGAKRNIGGRTKSGATCANSAIVVDRAVRWGGIQQSG